MDPWKHRSDGMKCRTCMWLVEKVAPEAEPQERIAGHSIGQAALATTPPIVGRCRRHAPTMNGYPVVFAADWCGDHELNENAIQEGTA